MRRSPAPSEHGDLPPRGDRPNGIFTVSNSYPKKTRDIKPKKKAEPTPSPSAFASASLSAASFAPEPFTPKEICQHRRWRDSVEDYSESSSATGRSIGSSLKICWRSGRRLKLDCDPGKEKTFMTTMSWNQNANSCTPTSNVSRHGHRLLMQVD